MLTTIKLYGELGKKYGTTHRYDVPSAPMATRMLAANYKGFAEDFRNGYYKVIVGDKVSGQRLDEKTMNFKVGARPIHIIPIPAGSKRGGGLKIILGLALLAPFAFEFAAVAATGGIAADAGVAAAIAGSTSAFGGLTTYGALASFGASMLFGGIASLFTPVPKVADYGSRERPDQRASFVFNGPVNRSQEGAPIPLIFGTCTVGSIIVSAGINTEQLL